ncbi:MAG: hypothetical protein ACYSX0_04840 [Planctomycetota bacterium]|jgi:hypothetical protein
MKAIPILAITNALALVLVVVLYVQQEDLQSQLKSARARPARTTPSMNDDLDQRMREWLEDYAPAIAARPAEDAIAVETPAGDERTAASPDPLGAAGTPSPPSQNGILQGPAMETFRRNVERANELNQEEVRLKAVADRLDDLVANNKIGAVTAKQKKLIAGVLVNASEEGRTRMRRFWGNPEMRSLPREERGALMRSEMESIQETTLKGLEQIVPAADAKTIVDDGLRSVMGMGMGGRTGRGGRTTGR